MLQKNSKGQSAPESDSEEYVTVPESEPKSEPKSAPKLAPKSAPKLSKPTNHMPFNYLKMPEKRKTRILVDMDGVLVDFETTLFQAYRAENPQLGYIEPENRQGMYMDAQYREKFGETEYQVLRDLLDRDHFYRDMLPILPAVDAVNSLLEHPRYEVFICTSPHWTNKTCAFDKTNWIKKYLPKIETNRIIMSSDKTVVDGDFLIDDNEVIKGANKSPKFKHVLCRCGHNKGIKKSVEMPLILEKWEDLMDIIR